MAFLFIESGYIFNRQQERLKAKFCCPSLSVKRKSKFSYWTTAFPFLANNKSRHLHQNIR